jgi:hypothetical protein
MTEPAMRRQPLPSSPSGTAWLATSATLGCVPRGAGGTSISTESGQEPVASPTSKGIGSPLSGAATAGDATRRRIVAAARIDMVRPLSTPCARARTDDSGAKFSRSHDRRGRRR